MVSSTIADRPTSSEAGRGHVISARQAATLVYYVAVLVGLVLLYGRGQLSAAGAGFIYQAF